MFIVYILDSKKLDLFYIGQTIDIHERITQHNLGLFENSFTSKTSDWELFYFIECNSRTQAIQIEIHIKKMKSRKYYFSLKEYPEIAAKLKLSYN